MVEQLRPEVERLARQAPPEHRDDLVQEGMIALWQAQEKLDPSFGPEQQRRFLLGAAAFRIQSKLRDLTRHDPDTCSLDTPVWDGEARLEETLEATGPRPDDPDHHDAQAVLRRLRPSQARAVWLMEGCGFKPVETARPLKISRTRAIARCALAYQNLERAKKRGLVENGSRLDCAFVEVKLTLRLTEEEVAAARQLAAADGVNLSEYFRRPLRQDARRRLKAKLPPSPRPGRRNRAQEP